MKQTFKPNAFKINFNENEFVVSFAETEKDDELKNEVNLQFVPEQIMSVIAPMFSSVIEYQEKYGADLGIKKKGE